MSDRITRDVDRLRREFDERFAEPVVARDDERQDVLVIGVGGAPYVISLRGARSLVRTPSVTRLPSRRPTLLGLTAIRGVLTALYDLASLIGEAPSGRATPEWTLLLAAGSVAVAFDRLEGHLRVPIVATHEGAGRMTVPVRGELRPLLRTDELASLIEGGGAATREKDPEER